MLIIRLPQPWMKWEDFTETALLETITLARNLLGITLVIFLTVSYSNKVVTIEDIARIRSVNGLIRSVGEYNNRNNRSSSNRNVTTVLTLEAGHLIDLIVIHNARRLGLPNMTVDNWNFTLTCAKLPTDNKWVGGSLAYLCVRPIQTVKIESACIGNLLTNDGRPWVVASMLDWPA